MLRQRSVAVLASAEGTDGAQLGGAMANAGSTADGYASGGGSEAWPGGCSARAGVSPADVDVAQLYDNFSGQVLLRTRGLRLLRAGECGPLAQSGAVRPGPTERCPPTRRAGTSPRRTCRASTMSSKAFASCAGESTEPGGGCRAVPGDQLTGHPDQRVLLADHDRPLVPRRHALPAVTDDTRPFFEAALEHRLVDPALRVLRHPPPPAPTGLPVLPLLRAVWAEVPGPGTLFTYSVVHQPFLPPWSRRALRGGHRRARWHRGDAH